MGQLEGKVALITGGTKGLGRAMAEGLASAGADVVIVSRHEDEALLVAKQISQDYSCRSLGLAADVTDEAQVGSIVTRIHEKFSQLDVLINNAGITKDQLMMRMSDDDWSRVIEVNLTSVMRLSRGVLRDMMKARAGRIVNISSVVGVTGNPGQANYVASKAGVIGMSKALAAEVASRGITVNCVAPGFIESAMTEALNDDQKGRILAQIPAGRMGSGDEVASAVVWLASAEASYVTGQTIHVNGGMAMI